jgi:hypothetical protein
MYFREIGCSERSASNITQNAMSRFQRKLLGCEEGVAGDIYSGLRFYGTRES